MPYNLRDIFSVLDILSTDKDDETNTISSQLGHFTDDKVISSESENWQHCGFASRPPNCQKNSDDCPQAICINSSDQDMVIAERDIKSQQIYGNLSAGETCLYAAGDDGNGQARILLKADGGINLYTKKDNVEANLGLGIFISAKNDTISIINSVGNGIIIDKDGVTIIGAPKSALIVGSTISLATQKVNLPNISCSTLSVGTSLQCVGPAQFTTVAAAGLLTAAKLVGSANITGVFAMPTGAVVPGGTGSVAGTCTITGALA